MHAQQQQLLIIFPDTSCRVASSETLEYTSIHAEKYNHNIFGNNLKQLQDISPDANLCTIAHNIS